MQNFGVANKEHNVVCYGIFWSGQLRSVINNSHFKLNQKFDHRNTVMADDPVKR